MPPWLITLLQRGKDIPWDKVPWAKLWAAATWLFKAGKTWLERNLTREERQELAYLMTRSKGRASSLTAAERRRFAELVRKAFFGAAGKKAVGSRRGSGGPKSRSPRKAASKQSSRPGDP